MYAPFFGLSQEPFSIAPDPRFLFMSERHREALAHLLYGLSAGGGFVLLTGEIGAGKTTVCRGFLEQIPSTCTVAYIFNPKLTVPELLRTVNDEFGVAAPVAGEAEPTVKAQVDALNAFLLQAHAQGRQAVLVIDEAQSLSAEVLEQLRLLTNLETAERKLLQIILIGQPELRDMLARPDLEQLSQRVIARYHLDALSAEETPAYIRHRLAVAGPNAALPFDAEALAALHRLSGGVPRRINLLADRALLGAYGQVQQVATRAMVEQAAHEVFGTPVPGRAAPGFSGQGSAPAWWQPRMVWPLAAGLAVGLAGLLLLLAWLGPGRPHSLVAAGPPASAPVSAPVAAPVAASAPLPAASTPEAVYSSDVGALLSASTSDAAIAWRALALRWNVAIGQGDACSVARQADLACLRGNEGGLPALRQMARPASLALRAPSGATVYAQLVALNDQHATLQAGSDLFRLSLPALAQIWRGEYSTLWKTPAEWRDIRNPLRDAATRQWISQRLNDATPGAADGTPSEPSLRERLRVYQVAQGLPTDAASLPLTMIDLNRRSGVIEPPLPLAWER